MSDETPNREQRQRIVITGMGAVSPLGHDLCSSWAGLEALLEVTGDDGPSTGPIPMLVLFDHEEIGSTSERGAGSALLPAIVERISLGLGGGREDHLRALAGSVCCSADMAHATHPNYADRHEPGHRIQLNGGPVEVQITKELA